MDIKPQIIKVTYGPSLKAHYKAVIVSYDETIFGNDLNIADSQIEKLPNILESVIADKIAFDGIQNANQLLIALIKGLANLRQTIDFRVEVIKAGEDKFQLVVECFHEQRIIAAIETAFSIVSFIKSPIAEPPLGLKNQIKQAISYLIMMSPGDLTGGMLRAAQKLNIPIYPLEANSFLTSFGQGNKSTLFDHALNEHDSYIGFKLQKDKSKSNDYIRMLGFPATEQRVARTFDMCRMFADQIGYPVVIKPRSEGQARGVTANIHSAEQLQVAYGEANRYSPNYIIVEKHVPGNVYRITVSNGEVIGAATRDQAQVTGDSINTIQFLLDKENQRRLEPDAVENRTRPLEVNSRLIQNLKNDSYSLESIPAMGKKVILGDVANRCAGGTLRVLDLSEIHPDNLEMAIDLSNQFRLDSVGIDIITPDISCSWREMGVVIEMNAYPGTAPALEERFLGRHFQNTNGRIDSTLVVSEVPQFCLDIFNAIKCEHPNAGLATREYATIKSGKLKADDDGLAKRCQSLLLNTSCDAIVVAITPDELVKDGLPIDYFEQCIIDSSSNFDDDEIKKAVKSAAGLASLEAWLEQFVGKIEKRK